MKISWWVLLVSLFFCSCGKVELGEEPPSWVTSNEAERIADQFVALKGYEKAKKVEERGAWGFYRYRYATNDTVLPFTVEVDRKRGKAYFVK